MFVFGIYLEIEVQYIWGLSFAYAKIGNLIKAFLLRLACSGYVIIGICFAVGFFAMEVGHKEEAVQEITQAQTNWQAKYNEYNRNIDYYQKQALNETDKRGPKAIGIEDKIAEYEEKRDALGDRPLNTDNTSSEKVSGNVFKYAEEVFKPLIGVTEKFLKFLIVGYMVFMIYLGVMLTYWKIEIDDDDEPVTSNKASSELSGVSSKQQTNKAVLSEVSRPLSEVSPGVSEAEPSEITEKQNKLLWVTESLYDVESELDPPKKLKDFTQAYRDVIGKGITWREFRHYKDLLEQIGAIKIEAGKNAAGVWEKNKIINYIKNAYEWG